MTLKLRNGEPSEIRERAYFVLTPRAQTPSATLRGEPLHMSVLGVHPAHSTPLTLTRPHGVAFTDCEVQRNLLIGIVIVVLIERARMRPGG